MSLTIQFTVNLFGSENADAVSLQDPTDSFGVKVAGINGAILVPADTPMVNTSGLVWSYTVENDSPSEELLACVKVTKNSTSTYLGFSFSPVQLQPGLLLPLPPVGCSP